MILLVCFHNEAIRFPPIHLAYREYLQTSKKRYWLVFSIQANVVHIVLLEHLEIASSNSGIPAAQRGEFI